MSTDGGSELHGIARQQELLLDIVENARHKAPEGWVHIALIYVAVGQSLELEVDVTTADGPYRELGGPIGFPDALPQLRELMYVRGRGTWFTLRLEIDSGGEVSTQFGYDRPMDEALIGFDLEQDLEMFPRDSVPDWISDEISETHRRSQLYDAAANSSNEVDGDEANPAEPVMGRTEAMILAADFIPEESDIVYVKIVRDTAASRDVVTTFAEIRSNGRELRKIDIFRDGSTGWACIGANTGGTVLDRSAVAAISEISGQSGELVQPISPIEFQTEWLVVGGW